MNRVQVAGLGLVLFPVAFGVIVMAAADKLDVVAVVILIIMAFIGLVLMVFGGDE